MKYKNKALGCVLCKKVEFCAQKCPESTQDCTWCPGFCPQAVNATCIPFGQTVTLVQGEEAKCCEMGDKGLAACCCLCPVQGRTRERTSQLQSLISRPFSTRFG